jgi:hypothetical protein
MASEMTFLKWFICSEYFHYKDLLIIFTNWHSFFGWEEFTVGFQIIFCVVDDIVDVDNGVVRNGNGSPLWVVKALLTSNKVNDDEESERV